MTPHDEIVELMAKIQKRHRLTKTELIAEMALAINTMLNLIEPGLKATQKYLEASNGN